MMNKSDELKPETCPCQKLLPLQGQVRDVFRKEMERTQVELCHIIQKLRNLLIFLTQALNWVPLRAGSPVI